MRTIFHAENANNTNLPARFTLYEYLGTWKGVLATEKESLIAKLKETPAVTEISEEEYQKCLAKIPNLPESMRPIVPPQGMPSVVGDGVPVIAEPKQIKLVESAAEVLQPVKVVTASEPQVDGRSNNTVPPQVQNAGTKAAKAARNAGKKAAEAAAPEASKP
jgi:hypothetical protein